MKFIIPPAEILPFGLRAMKMVAVADGTFAEQERLLLGAAQHLFGSDHDIDSLAPISPDELAAAVQAPELRRQLVYGMLALSLADGDASPAEAAQVEAFRAALGVDAHEVATFRKLSEGHLLAARLDVARRFWVREHIVAKAKKEGFSWLLKAAAAFLRIAEDTPLAAKYRALDSYPEGTLGRAYAEFIHSNHFSMPGEKGSPPEVIVMHDLTHVISGYGTTPSGEICVTAFHAGYRNQDPFTWILFSMMQFNMGIALTPIASGAKLQIDPVRWLDAFRRGSEMNCDLTDGSWDYWADMAIPLDEVRARYHVPPLAAAEA